MCLKDPSSHPDLIYWRHRKTDQLYQVLHYGMRESDFEPMVIYTSLGSDKAVWVRPSSEFFDGRFAMEKRN